MVVGACFLGIGPTTNLANELPDLFVNRLPEFRTGSVWWWCEWSKMQFAGCRMGMQCHADTVMLKDPLHLNDGVLELIDRDGDLRKDR